MISADGTSITISGAVGAIAAGIGYLAKAAWEARKEWLSLRRASTEEKDATRATILTLAQSQMNDVNATLFNQLKFANDQIAALTVRLDVQAETITKQAEEIATLKDRVRELEP